VLATFIEFAKSCPEAAQQTLQRIGSPLDLAAFLDRVHRAESKDLVELETTLKGDSARPFLADFFEFDRQQKERAIDRKYRFWHVVDSINRVYRLPVAVIACLSGHWAVAAWEFAWLVQQGVTPSVGAKIVREKRALLGS
jgi:hypothetical protein